MVWRNDHVRTTSSPSWDIGKDMVSNTALGFIAVVGSIFAFGSFGVPIKTPSVIAAKVDPTIFQCYYSLAVVASVWIVLSYAKFVFTAWGILGAALWVPASLMSIVAMKRIGISVAQGIWGGVSMLVSFLWGVIYFQDQMASLAMCIVGLFLLIVGVMGLSTCRYRYYVFAVHPSPTTVQEDPEVAPSGDQSINTERQPLLSESDRSSVMDSSPAATSSPPPSPTSSAAKASSGAVVVPRRDYIIGLGCAITLGLFNGSMLVPLRLAPDDANGINYIFSFAIGVAMVTPFLASLYFITIWRVPPWHPRITLLPGLLAGLLWSIGNYCSVYATDYLGLSIGFPLTQTCLLVAGLWGLLYYKEIRGALHIFQFFLAAGVVLGGAFLLGFFGTKS